jgi:transcriptional regulator with XRE-family HTH domain
MIGRGGMDFGGTLRRERIRAGLSQQQLAELAGIGASAVSRLERGERDPLLTTLLQVARWASRQANYWNAQRAMN